MASKINMTRKAKKFGTFGGVFTPSLLTILGVIMYMRLGWVVGEAGMIAAIGIIVIAHIISVTTGLSISSIATDKKIKAGGIYYMLSRTLGLPMGGAIGIALFVGTAFSISLYIVGFAESFLGIPFINDILHLEPGVEGYRIVGTAVIIILVVLAFISTSLAIKTQYLILGAIVLSLISIFVGYFVHPEFAPSRPLLGMAHADVSLEMVFAIFFPAVTGFTAGVAMSGDLRDPKRNIPAGTIMAITVGFIIYLALAISFACFVNREDLVNDTGFITKIAWIPALVVAGIWGATLSSALGGILGGPRILQAISRDKMMPKFFGRGYGSTNEPRNALLFIFIIAEGGILIGELNMIARIVTMFYLASYGFINLAYVLEVWASTDFRPSFKVSRLFGIVGFLFAFAIMFQLDVLAMLAAFAIMGVIYFLLKRLQIKLDFGDVWQSVWISVVRRGLQWLSVKTVEERNWQPNIILFSGGTESRPYLIEFGKSLVGKFGLLSNFDLIEEPSAKVLFPKHQQQQSVRDEDSHGIFTRRQTCRDIYEGIEMIARTYGFSGIEPNTVILGWARQTKNPKRFHKLLHTINALDYNIILIDYDKQYGYGKHHQIDIWWRGEGNNGNFALTLSKFMVTSVFWENAKIRLMIVNFENDKAYYIHRRADEILKIMRLDAEVKVINNQVERKPIYDIIRQESRSADIVFIGIPEFKKADEADFVGKTNALLKEIGTVVLMRASSFFNEINLGINKEQKSLIGISSHEISTAKELECNDSIHELLNVQMKDLSHKLIENFNRTFQVFVRNLIASYSKLLAEFNKELSENLDDLRTHYPHYFPSRLNRIVVKYQHTWLNKLNKQFSELKNDQFEQLQSLLSNVTDEYDKGLNKVWFQMPEKLMLYFPFDELRFSKDDTIGFMLYKILKRSGIRNRIDVPFPFSFKKYAVELRLALNENLNKIIEQTGSESVSVQLQFQHLLKSLSIEYDNLGMLASENNMSVEHIKKSKQTILKRIKALEPVLQRIPERISTSYHNNWIEKVNQFIGSTDTLKSAYQFSLQKNISAKIKVASSKLEKLVESFFSNHSLLLNVNEADNFLLQFNSLVVSELKEVTRNTDHFIQGEMVDKVDQLIDLLSEMIDSKEQREIGFEALIPASDILVKKTNSLILASVKKISRILRIIPSEITVIDETSYNDFIENQVDDIKTIEVSFLQMIEFLIDNKIVTRLNQCAAELQQSIREQLIKLKELYRSFLLTFGEYADNRMEETDSLNDFLKNQINNIDNTKKEIIKISGRFVSQVSGLQSEVTGHLNLYGITKFEELLKHYMHEEREQETISYLKSKYQNLVNWFTVHAVGFKYVKTQALSQAAVSQQENIAPGFNSQFLEITGQIQPSQDMLKQLPFFYKQLFSIKHTFHKEFWVPLRKESEQADIIYKQYCHLNEGILLITGDHYSGKSFLSYILAQKWNDSGKPVIINPPPGGSVSTQVFNEVIAEAFQEEKYNESVFERLSPGTIVIFENIEMWWQRSHGGLVILDHMMKIISAFKNRIFFILNTNIYAYKLLDKIMPLNDDLLGIINLNPMPVRSVENMIMLRHHGAGLDLVYKNKREDELTILKKADLFAKIYRYSFGNPGIALAAWIGSIRKYENDSLRIDPVELPDMECLDHIQHDALLVIIHLFLHRQLTMKRLIAILGFEVHVIERQIQFLWRMGLINKLQNDVYEVNIYWYPVLKQYLITNNYI